MGIFPVTLASHRPFVGNVPSKRRKKFFYNNEQFVKKWRSEILFIVVLFSLSVKGSAVDVVHCLADCSKKNLSLIFGG